MLTTQKAQDPRPHFHPTSDDLTFYPHRGGGASWKTIPSCSNDWIWEPDRFETFPECPEIISELHSKGWEDTGSLFTIPLALWILFSQLTDVCMTATAGATSDIRVWVQTADKKRGEEMPVLLAFPVHLEQQKQAIRQSSGSRKLEVKRALPPAQFGELALIPRLHRDRPTWVRCTISKLDGQAQQLQQQLGAALERLAARNDLERSAWLAQWTEVQRMACNLARNYWIAYQETQQLQRPHVPNVFQDGPAYMAMNMHVQGLHTAIYHHHEWKEESGMPASHTHEFSTGWTKTWLEKPGQEGINADLASEELTKHLAALSDLEADMITIQIAQAMTAAHIGAEVILTPEAILEYRGIKPMTDDKGWRHGHRTEDIQKVIEAFERTAWLRLKIWQQIKRRGGKDIEISEQSSYILIETRLYQRTLDETDNGRLLAWHYRMGKWLLPFMDENQAGRYFGRMMKKTLEYDYYRQVWEKRLARYFTVHLCIAAKDGAGHIKRRVGALLEECGLKLNTDNPQWNVERFKKALDHLKADGIIGDWKYTDDSQFPARKWLPVWLERVVAITVAPGALQAGYQGMIDRARERHALPKPQKSTAEGKHQSKHQKG